MKKTRIVTCLKCKCEFETELDKQGVPYNRLCEKHRRMTESEHWAENFKNISKFYTDSQQKRSKGHIDIVFNPITQVWTWVDSMRNWEEKFSHKDENEVIRYKNFKILEKALIE